MSTQCTYLGNCQCPDCGGSDAVLVPMVTEGKGQAAALAAMPQTQAKVEGAGPACTFLITCACPKCVDERARESAELQARSEERAAAAERALSPPPGRAVAEGPSASTAPSSSVGVGVARGGDGDVDGGPELAATPTTPVSPAAAGEGIEGSGGETGSSANRRRQSYMPTPDGRSGFCIQKPGVCPCAACQGGSTGTATQLPVDVPFQPMARRTSGSEDLQQNGGSSSTPFAVIGRRRSSVNASAASSDHSADHQQPQHRSSFVQVRSSRRDSSSSQGAHNDRDSASQNTAPLYGNIGADGQPLAGPSGGTDSQPLYEQIPEEGDAAALQAEDATQQEAEAGGRADDDDNGEAAADQVSVSRKDSKSSKSGKDDDKAKKKLERKLSKKLEAEAKAEAKAAAKARKKEEAEAKKAAELERKQSKKLERKSSKTSLFVEDPGLAEVADDAPFAEFRRRFRVPRKLCDFKLSEPAGREILSVDEYMVVVNPKKKRSESGLLVRCTDVAFVCVKDDEDEHDVLACKPTQRNMVVTERTSNEWDDPLVKVRFDGKANILIETTTTEEQVKLMKLLANKKGYKHTTRL